jgi:two-component system nitrogen regulation sensor histidine kinase NtrY
MSPLSGVLASLCAFPLGVAVARATALRRSATAPLRAAEPPPSSGAGRFEGAARDRLFGAVVEEAPMAILLLDAVGKMLLTNAAARELFFEGHDAAGENLLTMLGAAPAPFRDALLGGEDALFSVGESGEAETYLLSRRALGPGGEALTLVLVRPLTRELQQREVAVWKKLLRVVSHELQNSLAPISLLAHSARRIAKDPDKLDQLDKIFAMIQERTTHLKEFLDGYAELARLPAPRRAHVAWSEVLGPAREGHPRVCARSVSGTGYFDRRQIAQVVENLIKNAAEASSPPAEIELDVEPADRGATLFVRDRGPGMSAEVLKNALLPFYSTKERGTGLGLALCREVIEAHRGRITLQNREGGGLEVACFLPDSDRQRAARSHLTITRA